MAWPQDSAAASTLVDKKPPPKPTPETSTSTPAENFASSITGCQNTEQWDYDDGKCVPEDVNITAYQCYVIIILCTHITAHFVASTAFNCRSSYKAGSPRLPYLFRRDCKYAFKECRSFYRRFVNSR